MAKLFYYGDKISPNRTRTPEGFLICLNVPIARTGTMVYAAGELGLSGDPSRLITVNRDAADVFEPATLASFEGKPVTNDHPAEDVTPANYAVYEKGHVQNVRRGTGEHDCFLLADLHIKDPLLIADIESGKREVSCGYCCTYEDRPDGTFIQREIRGNHVAVVNEGRAGSKVAIKDSAQGVDPAADISEPQKGRLRMKRITTTGTPTNPLSAILRLFGVAVRDCKSADEIEGMADDAAAALEQALASEKADGKMADAGGGAAAHPDEQADKQMLTAALAPVMEKLEELGNRIVALEKVEEGEAKPEDALDVLLKRLGGGKDGGEIDPIENEEALTIPAEEVGEENEEDARSCDTAALALVKRLRPAIAGIQDAGDRKRMTDAVLALFATPADVRQQRMAGLVAATKKAAKKVADSAQPLDNAQQQAIYDALNPHKKGGK